MIAVLLYAALICNAITALRYPWTGMVMAYVIAILAPQAIWWWAFSGVRPSYLIIIPALVGFLIAVVRREIDYAPLGTPITRSVALLWGCLTISYFFGPYVHVVNEWRFYDPELVFSTLQKTYLTYFVAAVLITGPRRLGVASLVMVGTVLYLTYWANSQYLVYHVYGRLHGPRSLDGQGIYADQNDFAVLFVVGAPFLFYFGTYLRNKLLKWAIWLAIPFSWNAIFLTGSRGALVGVVVVLGAFSLRAKSKAVAICILAAFMLAFALEAGSLMMQRSQTITDYSQDESAMGRIEAWHAAIGMMEAHPLTGVGVASMGQAFPDFSDKRPRVAHNTFFQIGAEWGVVAGFTYLALIFSALRALAKNGARLGRLPGHEPRLFYCLNEACYFGLLGFFVCSMFLSLQGYEVLYFVLLLASGTLLGSGYYLKGAPAESGDVPARQRQRSPRKMMPTATKNGGGRIVGSGSKS